MMPLRTVFFVLCVASLEYVIPHKYTYSPVTDAPVTESDLNRTTTSSTTESAASRALIGVRSLSVRASGRKKAKPKKSKAKPKVYVSMEADDSYDDSDYYDNGYDDIVYNSPKKFHLECKNKRYSKKRGKRFTAFARPVNWFEALAQCRMKCMDLASISNDQENRLLIAELNAKKVNNAWIGVWCDSSTSGSQCSWLSTWTLLGGGYNQWAPAQPNNVNGNEQCVKVLANADYKWHDYHCLTLSGYVCEYFD